MNKNIKLGGNMFLEPVTLASVAIVAPAIDTIVPASIVETATITVTITIVGPCPIVP